MLMEELFTGRPEQWGLRGDEHVWAAMGARLAGLPIPDDKRALEELLVVTFNDIVGVDLMNEDFGDQGESWDSGVYREEFAHGGMSSGFVCLEVWRDRLIPLLVSRGKQGSGNFRQLPKRVHAPSECARRDSNP